MLIADSLKDRQTAITVPELAKMLTLSRRQLYKMASANRIPNFKVGTSVRFDPGEIREWIQEGRPVVKRHPSTSARLLHANVSKVA
jgi:excisionase family DNA binding protein